MNVFIYLTCFSKRKYSIYDIQNNVSYHMTIITNVLIFVLSNKTWPIFGF